MRLNFYKTLLYNKLNRNKKSLVYLPLIIYWVILFFLTTLPSESLPAVGIGDKFEHFFAYMILTFLFGLTIHFQSKFSLLKNRFIIYTLVIISLYGVIDEVHQIPIPGRYFDWLDLTVNFLGIIAGLFVIKYLIPSEVNAE